ncbi:MAG: hypothetical protein AAFV07_21355 [Bacteroidota bacterium]
MKHLISAFCLSILCLASFNTEAQTWRIHVNGNEIYPLNDQELGYFPILLYDNKYAKNIVVGGFGLGISYTIPLKQQLDFKGQVNIQRSRFYDRPVALINPLGEPIGGSIGINTQLNALAMGLAIWAPGQQERWKTGAGLGLRSNLWAGVNYGTFELGGDEEIKVIRDRTQSRLILLLPVEVQVALRPRWTLAGRAEYAITPTSRFPTYRQQRMVHATVEVSYTLTKP